MDPVGLSLENYDGVGGYRTVENGAPINASGTFEGKPYKDAIDLEKLLHDSAAVPSCLSERVYEYGVGRAVTAGERDWLKYVNDSFAKNRYAFLNLVRTVATSDAFQAVSAETLASK